MKMKGYWLIYLLNVCNLLIYEVFFYKKVLMRKEKEDVFRILQIGKESKFRTRHTLAVMNFYFNFMQCLDFLLLNQLNLLHKLNLHCSDKKSVS